MVTKTKLKNKLNTETSYIAYGIAINKKWDAENKLDGASERAKQASRVIADDLVARDAQQIDLIAEPRKDKPHRDRVINALTDAMAEKKRALYKVKSKKELHKRATKSEIAWCAPSYIARQYAEIEKSEQRTFIRKSDVKNFLTKNIGTAIDDLKAMLAYRLGEEKLSGKDGKAGIAPTKRADKKPTVKKDRVDTAPKSDIERAHALVNELVVLCQNTKCPILKKISVAICALAHKIVKLIINK
jgi:hypothetical protein